MFDSTGDLRPGLNDPSPVTRVLILGYCDGATDGVMRLADGESAYRFDMIRDGIEEREFALRPLAPEAWDDLVAIIGEHIAPKWPNWVPLWKFPDFAIQKVVERKVDAILEGASVVEWEIATRDSVGFGSLTARPLIRARAVAV